jgi:hypothetical protein
LNCLKWISLGWVSVAIGRGCEANDVWCVQLFSNYVSQSEADVFANALSTGLLQHQIAASGLIGEMLRSACASPPQSDVGVLSSAWWAHCSVSQSCIHLVVEAMWQFRFPSTSHTLLRYFFILCPSGNFL